MEISRSETHKRSKQNRKNKRRRLIALNLTLLGIICILGGILLTIWNDDLADSLKAFGFGNRQPAQSEEVDDDSAAKGENDHESSGEAGEDGTAVEPEGQIAENPEVAIGGDNSAIGTDEPDEPATLPTGDEKVILSFVGDILLGPYVNKVVQDNGPNYLYEATKSYLDKADITAGNLEAPITSGGTPHEGKDYVYKASPDTLPALKAAGFDLVSLANNHILDQGIEGMRDTITHLNDIGIAHMGAGENDTEAFAPYIIEAKGIKVAYIGVSEVIFSRSMKADKNVPGVAEAYDPTRAINAIKAAKEQADIVVVMPHWGENLVVELEKKQLDLGKAFIDAGADLVIGAHPHILQGFEKYNGKWIAYSLGNFIFGVGPKGLERESAVLDVVCEKNGDCELQLHPMFIENGQPKPMDQIEGRQLLDRLMAISPGLRFEDDGTIKPE